MPRCWKRTGGGSLIRIPIRCSRRVLVGCRLGPRSDFGIGAAGRPPLQPPTTNAPPAPIRGVGRAAASVRPILRDARAGRRKNLSIGETERTNTLRRYRDSLPRIRRDAGRYSDQRMPRKNGDQSDLAGLGRAFKSAKNVIDTSHYHRRILGASTSARDAPVAAWELGDLMERISPDRFALRT